MNMLQTTTQLSSITQARLLSDQNGKMNEAILGLY